MYLSSSPFSEAELPGDPSYAEFPGYPESKSQARVAFEIVNANIVGEGRQKHVVSSTLHYLMLSRKFLHNSYTVFCYLWKELDTLPCQITCSLYVSKQTYTILVLKGPGISTAEAAIQRRYSDFERLHSSLKKRYSNELREISFPKKILTGNFKAETIAQRSRAFEQYLCHVYSISALRLSSEFISFFYEDDLRKAYDYLREKNYQKSLPILKSSLLLQQRLQGESHSEVLATLCALIAVHAELEQDEVAQSFADAAFQCLENDDRSLYLPSLLQLSIRLCWKLGKDKKDLEARQQRLKDNGLNVDNIPPLISVVKERFCQET